MTSISLEDSVFRALEDHAAAAGLSVQEYLRTHLVGADAPVTEQVAPADVDRWLDEISAGLTALPRLPDNLSRDDIYDEHD